MPIVARDLDVSERKFIFHAFLNGSAQGSSFLMSGLGNGGTYPLFVMPFPFEVVSVGSGVGGASGTINLTLNNLHNTGAGSTLYGAMNSSFALIALGTSIGTQWVLNGTTNNIGWSLPVSGSTILQGVAGDVLTIVGLGTGAVGFVTISVVVKKLQDIASHFGVST
jgi:hypothetical protein